MKSLVPVIGGFNHTPVWSCTIFCSCCNTSYLLFRLEDEKEAMGIAVKLGLIQIKEETKESAQRKLDEKQKYMNSLQPADPKQYNGKLERC